MKRRAAILHDASAARGPSRSLELDPPRAGEVLVEMAAAGAVATPDDPSSKATWRRPNEMLRRLGLPTMFPTIGGHERALERYAKSATG